MQSEYSTKYNTKSDAINLNGPLLQCANVLADKTMSQERKSKVVLSKIQNHINKAIVYPLTMLSSYLLGHGDFWWPMKTRKHDAGLFQRALKPRQSAYEDDGTACTIAPNGFATAPRDTHNPTTPEEGEEVQTPQRVQAINAEIMYTCRHEALKNWSPFEMTMAFECCPATTTAAQTLRVNSLFPFAKLYGHKPLVNREGKPVIHIPQLYRDPPLRPDANASHDEKEDYAAFALGNFYPYDHLLGDLTGDHLWDKFLDWEAKRPRGKKDDFAMMCLANYQLRGEARLQMRVDRQRINMQRRLVTAVADPVQGLDEKHYNLVSILQFQVVFSQLYNYISANA